MFQYYCHAQCVIPSHLNVMHCPFIYLLSRFFAPFFDCLVCLFCRLTSAAFSELPELDFVSQITKILAFFVHFWVFLTKICLVIFHIDLMCLKLQTKIKVCVFWLEKKVEKCQFWWLKSHQNFYEVVSLNFHRFLWVFQLFLSFFQRFFSFVLIYWLKYWF